MSISKFLQSKLESELTFKYSRSSGSGGQHVNKVNTKVELRFNVLLSENLSNSQKAILLGKLKNRINSKYELVLVSQDERSQHKNKRIVTEKFFLLLDIAFAKQKIRKTTKPNSASVEKRLRMKRKNAEKKSFRRTIDF
jgi:ribosome-associated protein